MFAAFTTGYPIGSLQEACAMFRLAICMSLALAALLPVEAGAQAFPTRTVRYVLPLPAGQETDVFARVLARRLAENWGQQVLVDNRPGGGTVIGTEVVAKAAPDGYTLLHAITPHVVNPTLMVKLPYDTLRDL